MNEERDILSFLDSGKGKNLVLRTMTMRAIFRFRVRAVAALLEGRFSIAEFSKLVLPLAYRPHVLGERYAMYVTDKVKEGIKPFLRADDSISLFGKPFYPPLGNFYEFVDLIDQVIVADQYHAKRFLKEDSIVIDAGANIGTFSVFAAHLSPKGRIYSFEPVKYTFGLLKKNTEGYANVTCTNMGLGDVPAERNIFVSRFGTGGNVFEDSGAVLETRKKEGIAETEKASITTIDDFVEKNKVSRVDFIKMDTEGYEAKILNGAKKTIAKWKPVLAMSAYHNPEDKKVLPEIVNSIAPGYVCEPHSDYEEDFIFYQRERS